MTERAPEFTEWQVNGHTIRCLHTTDDDGEGGVQVMPNFFNADFNVATATGFTRVWEGSTIFRNYIERDAADTLDFKGKNCIELGSGCGMFGLNLAALGANVLLTDVVTVTTDSTALNVRGNSKGEVTSSGAEEGAFFVPNVEAHKVGDGVAAAAPIDWNQKVLADNIKAGAAKMDYLIGCECVWLPYLLQPFAATLALVLGAAPVTAKALVCYPVRGNKPTSFFTNQAQFEAACEAEGLVLTMLQFTPKNPEIRGALDTCIYSIALAAKPSSE